MRDDPASAPTCASWWSSSRSRASRGRSSSCRPPFRVTELADVLGGRASGRAHAAEVTVFDSVGFALEDFAALRYLYRMHQEERGAEAADRPGAGPGGSEGPVRAARRGERARGGEPRGAGMSPPRAAALIGAPTDVGAADRGASMGPEALRVAGLGAALAARDLEVHDLGNLHGPGNPWSAPQGGYRHLARSGALERAGARGLLRAAARRAPADPARRGSLPEHRLDQRGRAPLPRGGPRLRVLWLDAHADFNTSELSPSGNVHGMPLACLCGFGPASAHRHRRRDARDRARPGCARSASAASMKARSASCTSRDWTCSTCATSMRWACARPCEHALAGMDGDTHLHVSFDVDFLDPEIAPGVGTRVRGRPDLPRGAAVHGDDRRHAAAGFARRGGAQSRLR